jgi:stage II sporulation protein D
MRIGKSFTHHHMLLWGLLFLLAGLFFLRGPGPAPEIKPLSPSIRLYLHQQEQVVTIGFEEYIAGVVAAEMPASFELEALKGQAVCARTYAYNRMLQNHVYPQDADVTDDITNCQAYLSQEEFNLAHPGSGEAYWAKIGQAVGETAGIILLYEGQPADTVYHSTCGGQTENALDAWGKEVAYLHSVNCEYCRNSSYYERTTVLSASVLQTGLAWPEPVRAITVSERTAAGNVVWLEVDGQPVSGEEFRSRFSLPSRWLETEPSGDGFSVRTRGYGHRVGMCQFGAGGMAAAGYSYREIVGHYYAGSRCFDMAAGKYMD